MLSYNQIKTFEVGSSFRWAASIIGGSAPVDNAAFNLLGGKYIPCTSISFSDRVVKTLDIPVIKDFSLTVPYLTLPITEVKITFEDDKAGAIRQAVQTWIAAGQLPNGRVPKIENFYKQLQVEIFNPDLTVAYKRILYIIPKDELDFSKDAALESDSYELSFIVVGDDS